MSNYHFFDPSTGFISSQSYNGPLDQLPENTPPGKTPIQGWLDWQAQRIDVATGNVIDYQPPAPPDDTMQTWAWNATTKRWSSIPTQRALDTASNADVNAQLSALDAKSIRPLIALTLNPASIADKASLQAVSDQITALRVKLKVLV